MRSMPGCRRWGARSGSPRTVRGWWTSRAAMNPSAGRTWRCAASSSWTRTASGGCCGCCAGASSRPGAATARAPGCWTTTWPRPLRAKRRATRPPWNGCSTPTPRRRASCPARSWPPCRHRSTTRPTRRRRAPASATARRCGDCRTRWPRAARNWACPTACWRRGAGWRRCSMAKTGPACCRAGAAPSSSRCWRRCWPLAAGPRHRYNALPRGAIAQLGERVVRNDEVGRSILPGSTTRWTGKGRETGLFLCLRFAGELLPLRRDAGCHSGCRQRVPQGDGCPVPQPDATDDRNGVIEAFKRPRGPLQPATGRRSLCSLPLCLVGTALRPAVRALPANIPCPASRRMPANPALPRFTSAAVLLAALAACGGGKGVRGDEAPASAPVPAASAPALPPLRIGLALGGGAAKGFAHIGAIKMLEANGIRADVVAGTSAGSVVGALYASGMDAFTMQERAVALDESTLRDVRLFSGGLVQGQALQDYVNREIGAQPIERLAKPFAAVSTRLDTGDRVVFVRGNTGQAVRASSSVPGVFEPVRIGAHSYVDGGVVSPVP